jgi:hypothetical protein
MKKNYLLLVLCFLPCMLFAQSNYKQGYVINLKGDTTRGLIDYKEWEQNPKNISFKHLLNEGLAQVFSTKDIRYFEVSGFEYYQAFTVNISLGSNDLQNLSITADTATKTDNVFLKVLQKGKNVSLFCYYDGLKTRFYILDNSVNVPQELLYRVYLNPDDKSNIITRSIYYAQLSTIANNNHVDVSQKIASMQYKAADMRKIVTEINGGDVKKIAKEYKKSNAVRFFAGIGAYAGTLKYTGEQSAIPLVGSSATSVSPQLSIGLDGYLNPNVGTIVFRGELSLSMASYSLSKTSASSNTTTNETISQKVKQYIISVSPQFIYNFYNTSLLKIYAGAGLSLNFAAYPTNQYNDQTSGFNNQTMADFPKLESLWASIPIKLGAVINKNLDLSLTYVPAATVTTYSNASGSISSYQFGINYFFGK